MFVWLFTLGRADLFPSPRRRQHEPLLQTICGHGSVLTYRSPNTAELHPEGLEHGRQGTMLMWSGVSCYCFVKKKSVFAPFLTQQNEVSLHVAVRDLRGTISGCCVDGNMFLMSWWGDEIRSRTSSLSSWSSVLDQQWSDRIFSSAE